MKRKALAFLMAFLVCASTSSAATFVWSNAATTSAWGTTTNWIPIDPPPLIPGAGDNANIGFPAQQPSVWPVVNDTRFVGGLFMDWHASDAGTTSPELTVGAGGLVVVSGQMGMAFASGGSSNPTVNITGGGTLQVLTQLYTVVLPGAHTATINIDQGVLYLGGDTNVLGAGTTIDINQGAAAFQLFGDQSAAVNTWIQEGKITALSGAWNVQVDVLPDLLGPGLDLTNVYAVIPEPSAAALLGFGALGLLSRRRR